MKTILPLLAILGTFSGALYYFRAAPPKRTPEAPAQPAATAEPALAQPVAPAPELVTAPAPKAPEPEPDTSKMSLTEFRAESDRLRAEAHARRLPALPGEFTITGVEIVTSSGPAEIHYLTGRVMNNGTRTAHTLWATTDGTPAKLCLYAAEPPRTQPLAPGQSTLFKRPIASPKDPSALTVQSIEITP